MKFIVELLAHGKEGEVREVEFDNVYATSDLEATRNLTLRLIFEHGQNERQPQDHPSVSVGDVIRLGEDRYLVLPSGFKRLSQAAYERYKAIPRDQRAVRCYLDLAISKL